MSDQQEEVETDPLSLAEQFSTENECDVLYINSDIQRGLETLVMNAVSNLKTEGYRKLVLILVTNGGNADVAYKISRVLQDAYPDDFSIFVPGWCKSAGTLIALGASQVLFDDAGELGPLDIQLGKKDEIFGYVSGLDLDYGLVQLRKTAFSMFEYFMLQTLNKSGYQVTFKTSAEVAASLTQPYIQKLAEQISPMNIGETVRLMAIARDYGKRLNEMHENLQDDDALDRLISGYSSHSFVIDLREAQTIFRRAERAPERLLTLMGLLGHQYRYPLEAGGSEPTVLFLRRRGEAENGAGNEEHEAGTDEGRSEDEGGQGRSDDDEASHSPTSAEGDPRPDDDSESAFPGKPIRDDGPATPSITPDED